MGSIGQSEAITSHRFAIRSLLPLTTHHAGPYPESSLTLALYFLHSMSHHVTTYLESLTNSSVPSQSPKFRSYELSLDYFNHLIIHLPAFKISLFINLTKIRYCTYISLTIAQIILFSNTCIGFLMSTKYVFNPLVY